MTKYYFGYGMNTNYHSMKSICPNSKDLGAATLSNHKLRFALYADIVPTPNEMVHGVLWEITTECLRMLDMREGYPNYYDRKIVKVNYNGVELDAWVYYMQPGNELAPPLDYYFTMCCEGYREHNVDTKQLYEALNFDK